MGTVIFNSAYVRRILAPRLASTNEAELTSFLYAQVRDALDRFQPRQEIKEALAGAYSQAESEDSFSEQDAIGNVLACFEGYCSPSDAL